MEYILSFLEGIITFISPCLLPMLPIYVTYFAGQNSENNRHMALLNSIGFVTGFSIVFVSFGAIAGAAGNFLINYSTLVNIILGTAVIIFGINFIGIINIKVLNQTKRIGYSGNKTGFFPSMVLGLVFSVGWTPCIGAFLGSALMLAASQGESLKGILMLICFSIGLGIPFVVSALLIENLKSSFDFIKRNYRIINLVSGIILVIIGILIATGLVF